MDSAGIITIADGGNFTLRRALTTALNGTLVAPTIASGGNPSSVTVVQGANATFTVTLGTPAASPTPTYQWQRQATGTYRLRQSGGRRKLFGFGRRPRSRSSSRPRRIAATSSKCVISNSAGSVTSSTAALTVVTPPSIQYASQLPLGGGRADRRPSRSRPAGTPAPTYQWYFNGTAISGATGSSPARSPP